VVGQDQGRENTAHGMAFRRHTLGSVDEPTLQSKNIKITPIISLHNSEHKGSTWRHGKEEYGNGESLPEHSIAQLEEKYIGPDHLR
jgi:hypothetical protein